MPVHIIDHTSPKWAARKKNENGAATYSADIMITQSAHWIEAFEDSSLQVVISTCPLFTDISPSEYLPFIIKGKCSKSEGVDLAIQYLHTYPFKEPIGYINKVYNSFNRKAPGFRMIFISAYQSYVYRINNWARRCSRPIQAIYIPMAIDTSRLDKIRHSNRKIPKHNNRIIWFGNLYRDKSTIYHQIREVTRASGYHMDVINRGKLNGKTSLNQLQAWGHISDYRYGIGVGRCALEMYALGLNVMIAGANFGGIITGDADYQVQQATNFNGRVITYDRDIHSCLAALPESHLPDIPCISEMNHASMVATSV